MFVVYLNRILMLKVKTMERGRQKTSEKKRVEQITLLPFNVRNYLNAKFHSSLSSSQGPFWGVGTWQWSSSQSATRWLATSSAIWGPLRGECPSAARYTYTWVAIRDALLCPPPLSHYCSLSCHDEVGWTFLTETEFIYKARVFSVRGLYN